MADTKITSEPARNQRLFATAASAISGRLLLAVVVISELVCLAIVAAIVWD
jgi:hypothetical protein